MRIVVSDFISLDGVVQAPGGATEDTDAGFAHGGWSMPFFDVEKMGPVIDATMASTEALLFGRRTWQSMAAAWPGRAGDPFADRMNEIPKYVVSRALSPADLQWSNSTLLPPGDVMRRCAACVLARAGTSRSWAAAAWPGRSSATTSSMSTD